MPTQLSKSQLIEKIATATELSKRDVKSVMETLVDVGHKELKKNGLFLVPGFAKFVVVKKPATKARKGVNPFTGEEMMFKAKPARKIVRARARERAAITADGRADAADDIGFTHGICPCFALRRTSARPCARENRSR